MLSMLLTQVLEIREISDSWENKICHQLLDMVVEMEWNALIDTGSLLAGITNEKAAARLAKAIKKRAQFTEKTLKFEGVIYFNSEPENPLSGQWMVVSCTTLEVAIMHQSPILQRNSLILFDDARCRGSDMKLPADAVAGITLGSGITKDKLLQGAGRLRLLGNNQKLVVVCPSQVKTCLKDFSMTGIIEWVLDQTIRETERGVLTWAHHGLLHAKSLGDPQKARINDNWDVASLYNQNIETASVPSIVHSLSTRLQDGDDMRESQIAEFSHIHSLVNSFAFDLEMTTASHEEECEREMYQEAEEEEEMEKQVLKVSPHEEPFWDYRKALQCSTIQDLKSIVSGSVVRLSVGIGNFLDIPGIEKVLWEVGDANPIYATENYFCSIKHFNGETRSQSIRLVDAILLLGDSSMILLSDREADGILEHLCLPSLDSSLVRLVNYCRLLSSKDRVVGMDITSDVPLALGAPGMPVPARSWVSTGLLNGNTQFTGAIDELDEILAVKESRKAVASLVHLRGKRKFFGKSDLERSCKRIR
ncbi:MAG: hypothetical protein SGCHY_002870 [Lobulomycetales sp.]